MITESIEIDSSLIGTIHEDFLTLGIAPEVGIEVVSAALEAAVDLDEHRKLLDSDLVFDSLNDAMRRAGEADAS